MLTLVEKLPVKSGTKRRGMFICGFCEKTVIKRIDHARITHTCGSRLCLHLHNISDNKSLNHHNAKKVYVYSYKGDYLYSCGTIRQAADITGALPSCVSEICNKKGKRNTANNYRFSFKKIKSLKGNR